MDEIKIIWSNIAITQRNKVFEYWNNRNKSNTYSKKINKSIYEKLNPLLGKFGDISLLEFYIWETTVWSINIQNLSFTSFRFGTIVKILTL